MLRLEAKNLMSKKSYGSRGQTWHPDFISYMEEIASNPIYQGMPDAYTEDGRVQWEAPSNRGSGRFKDTHHKRRDWWRRKAATLGIGDNEPQWISRTAKSIHPTKTKPCKRCGRVMEISYVYPQKRLIERIKALAGFDSAFIFHPFEPIDQLVERLVGHHGPDILALLPRALRTGQQSEPALPQRLTDWKRWLRRSFIPSEPSLLSPGAMSNAPDRFDGFHSFNLCCRGKADAGRDKQNLASYVTDRRVFEYWNDGDWIAADHLMGWIRANAPGKACVNGHPGPVQADHVGPLSLGFTHRPEFQLLCRSCNSGKNNRLSLRDVVMLRKAENDGIEVSSWHSIYAWNALQDRVKNDETALRLSKILRDNRKTTMYLLGRVLDKQHLAFLVTFLHLERADYAPTLTITSEAPVVCASVQHGRRANRLAAVQKARRLRVAFEALTDYNSKENRSSRIVWPDAAEQALAACLRALRTSSTQTKTLDRKIAIALKSQKAVTDPAVLSPSTDPTFATARGFLAEAMHAVAIALTALWNDDRYVRSDRD